MAIQLAQAVAALDELEVSPQSRALIGDLKQRLATMRSIWPRSVIEYPIDDAIKIITAARFAHAEVQGIGSDYLTGDTFLANFAGHSGFTEDWLGQLGSNGRDFDSTHRDVGTLKRAGGKVYKTHTLREDVGRLISRDIELLGLLNETARSWSSGAIQFVDDFVTNVANPLFKFFEEVLGILVDLARAAKDLLKLGLGNLVPILGIGGGVWLASKLLKDKGGDTEGLMGLTDNPKNAFGLLSIGGYLVSRMLVRRMTKVGELSWLAQAASLSVAGGLAGYLAAPSVGLADGATERAQATVAGALGGLYDSVIGERVSNVTGSAVSGILAYYATAPTHLLLEPAFQALPFEG